MECVPSEMGAPSRTRATLVRKHTWKPLVRSYKPSFAPAAAHSGNSSSFDIDDDSPSLTDTTSIVAQTSTCQRVIDKQAPIAYVRHDANKQSFTTKNTQYK